MGSMLREEEGEGDGKTHVSDVDKSLALELPHCDPSRSSNLNIALPLAVLLHGGGIDFCGCLRFLFVSFRATLPLADALHPSSSSPPFALLKSPRRDTQEGDDSPCFQSLRTQQRASSGFVSSLQAKLSLRAA